MNTKNAENMKRHVISAAKEFLEQHFGEDGADLGRSFEDKYVDLLQEHEQEAADEVEGIRRLITSFKPALASVLQPCEEFDNLLTMVLSMLKAPWEGAHRREKKPSPRRNGPVIPGSDQSVEIGFHCAVCEGEVDVSHEEKMQILNSEGEVELPSHCGQEVKIRISRKRQAPKIEEVADKPFEPVELLMGHLPADNVQYMKVLSVGIDIGSSTSHLIFSRLTMKRERSLLNISNRFNLVNREIIYQSSIIFTPLVDRYNIDIEAVIEFCEEEYKRAGITPEMVATGAVLVTGETAKKQNAAEIVSRLASESGRFVSAAAGPNLESLLSARGSGIVDQTLHTQKTVLNVDVGGGTSNLAIASNGQIIGTSCINVGGRLLGIEKNFKIWRIDGPTQFLMKELGMSYQIGDTIREEDARTIATEYAKALVEVMKGPAESTVAKELMMTDDLDFSIPVDEYSFSGGVSELLYGGDGEFDDIGAMLADEIRTLVEEQGLSVIEPPNKIRATVIGAGAFSLSVSGSTCYFDKSIEFPITNIPIIPVNVTRENYRPGVVEQEIHRALSIHDMKEGDDIIALYFKDSLFRSYSWLQDFVKSIERALPETVARKMMVILLFQTDIGKMVGLTTRRETSIQHNIISLDELFLEEGDWIDIGPPLHSGQVFPVTVKSLVFYQDRTYS
ncbi:MAG: ethanolamine ammonia-lyase reactivating factor EutA [Candidatus Thorarchaeota archaeon]|nr:MAG: ethanolamine ammonia-lyase reactivating factor EutA [Candidatus Thorarchaeota archaeon]